MDVDLHGPSIGHIMGLKNGVGITADKKLIPVAHSENLKVVSSYEDEGLLLISGSMPGPKNSLVVIKLKN